MFDLVHYQHLLFSLEGAVTNQEKGALFEELTEYFFSSLDGLQKMERDIHIDSEEIDLVFWNAQIEEVMKPWDFTILIECKNWNTPIGAQILDGFIGKLRRRCLKTGILIAAKGVTGTFLRGDGNEVGAIGIIRSALQEGIRIIVITLDELQCIDSVDAIRNLVKKKYCKLFVHRLF